MAKLTDDERDEYMRWLGMASNATWVDMLSRMDGMMQDRHAVRYSPAPDEMHMLRHCMQGFEHMDEASKFHGLHSRAAGRDPAIKLPVWATQLLQCDDDGWLRTQRIIVCAAIRIRDPYLNTIVIPSSRHTSPISHQLYDALPKEHDQKWPRGDDQGFIDNFDNYWTRKEAMSIAKLAGQVNFKTNGGDNDELYSEGLY